MIAKLIGVLDSLGEDSLIIDVSGVGYLVFCSSRTLRSIGKLGDLLTLFIE
nr:Holliday junction branch migration protein RuvA [Candidatus Poribacteria bacterium]